MKKTICGVIMFASLFLMLGIVGGVEHGKSVANMWWCVPLLATMWVSGRIGELFN